MIINEIVLKDFLSFKEKSIKINSKNVLILGDNGFGKTALIDAILFALYGKSIRDIPLDRASTSVTLSFTNNNNYTIDRSYIGVKLFKDNIVSDEEISNILGSFEDFIAKCLIKQEYLKILDYNIIDALKETFCIYRYDNYSEIINRLLEENNATLHKLEGEKEVLERLFNALDNKRLEEEIKKLEEEKRAYNQQLENAERRLILLEKEEASNKEIASSIEELKAKITFLNEELKSKESLLESLSNYKDISMIKKDYNEFVKLDNKIKLLDKKRIRYEILTNLISLLESIIEDKKNASLQLSNDLKLIKERYTTNLDTKRLREEMIKLDKSKIELEEMKYKVYAEIEVAKERLNEVLARVKDLKKSKRCYICNQPLPDTKLLATHMNEEADNIKMVIKDKEKELSDVMVKLREVDTKIHQLESMISKAEISVSISKDLEKLSKDTELTLLNAKLSKYKKELAVLRFEPKSYEKAIARYEELTNKKIIEEYATHTSKFYEWTMLNNEITKIKSTISIYNKRLDSLLKKKSNTIYDEIVNTKEEIVKIKSKLEVCDILLAKRGEVGALGSKELKSRLDELTSSIKDINNEINALRELKSILEEVLSYIISRTIELLEPYLREMNMQIAFRDNNLIVNGKEFANLSRGEKALVYLALRSAYMQALNAPLIIIDNNLSIIDKDKVKLLLSNIKVPLLVTSHQDLSQFFSKVIKL